MFSKVKRLQILVSGPFLVMKSRSGLYFSELEAFSTAILPALLLLGRNTNEVRGIVGLSTKLTVEERLLS